MMEILATVLGVCFVALVMLSLCCLLYTSQSPRDTT